MVIDQVTVRVMPDGRISAADAARMLGRSGKTLANWRLRGLGPRSFRVHGRVFYQAEDVRTFR